MQVESDRVQGAERLLLDLCERGLPAYQVPVFVHAIQVTPPPHPIPSASHNNNNNDTSTLSLTNAPRCFVLFCLFCVRAMFLGGHAWWGGRLASGPQPGV